MALTSVILQDEERENGSRYLGASYDTNGDLRIEGQDLARSTGGFREYEWVWTIRAADLPFLKQALGNSDDILQSLKTSFSNENAAKLETFLKDNKIAFEFWNRYGD